MTPHDTGMQLATLMNTIQQEGTIPLRSAIACMEFAIEHPSHRHQLAHYMACVQEHLPAEHKAMHAQLDALLSDLSGLTASDMERVNWAYRDERMGPRSKKELPRDGEKVLN